MTQAVIGWGTLFQTQSTDSPGVWITMAEVTALSPPGPSRDVLDTSTGNAPYDWRTSVPGMPGVSEVSLEFNFITTGNSPADHDYYSDLKSEMDDQVIRSRRIVFPNGRMIQFDAFITALAMDVPTGAQIKATAKFQVVGSMGAIV